MDPLRTTPILAVRNITATVLSNIICPASILANNLIINDIGLVNIPIISIIGIIGIALRKIGTSGQNISL